MSDLPVQVLCFQRKWRTHIAFLYTPRWPTVWSKSPQMLQANSWSPCIRCPLDQCRAPDPEGKEFCTLTSRELTRRIRQDQRVVSHGEMALPLVEGLCEVVVLQIRSC